MSNKKARKKEVGNPAREIGMPTIRKQPAVLAKKGKINTKHVTQLFFSKIEAAGLIVIDALKVTFSRQRKVLLRCVLTYFIFHGMLFLQFLSVDQHVDDCNISAN